MGEAGHTIHPDAEFLSIWEPVKPDKLCFLKIRGWHSHGAHLTSPQGDARKDGGVARPKQVQNPAGQILLDLELESKCFWLKALPSRPSGSAVPPTRSAGL